MHDPEEFQKATVKAITDLQQQLSQVLSRQLALGAMVKSVLLLVPLEALPALREEYDLTVDRLAADLPPKYQRPQHWEHWSDVLATLQTQLQQHRDHQTGPG